MINLGLLLVVGDGFYKLLFQNQQKMLGVLMQNRYQKKFNS